MKKIVLAVIEGKSSPVEGFDVLRKGRQTVVARTEPLPDVPKPKLDRGLFARNYSRVQP